MEQFFSDPKTIERYRSGPLGGPIQKLADLLVDSGFRRLQGRKQLCAANHFGTWLLRRKPVRQATLEDVSIYLRRHGNIKRGDGKALTRLFGILQEEGTVGTPSPVDIPRAIEIVLKQFADYLNKERGISPETIQSRRRVAARFLRHCFGEGPLKWRNIEPRHVVRFIQKEASAAKTTLGAKRVTTDTRSFLLYARFVDLIQKELAAAVPAVASWSLGNVPKGLPKDDVARILKSCDRKKAGGRRDFAILLLLSKLGLRGCEVARLELDDIDWDSGLIRIVGKSGKPSDLPLPTELGRAIVAYLRHGRPNAASRKLFLRIPAPHVPLKRRSVGGIVKQALERAGVRSQSKGSHQLRHAVATNLLQAGASLDEIGEVLRHEDHRSTMIYAKVDFKALRPLAQAWPGSAK